MGFLMVLFVLIEGIVNFGFMSCCMKLKEIEVFEKCYGYKLIEVCVVIDVFVVFVYKDNLIKGLCID